MADTHPTKTIGLLIHHFSDYVYITCTSVMRRAQELNYNTRVFCLPSVTEDKVIKNREISHYSIRQESMERILNLVELSQLDGLFIHTDVSDFIDKSIVEDFIRTHPQMPVVTISTEIKGASLVVSDNYASSALAVEHLIVEHDSRKIAYIRGPADNAEANERFQAYKDILAKHEIPFDERYVYQGDWFFDAGESAIKSYIDEFELELDAVVGANDNMAYSAMEELKRRQYDIPNDVKIIGYDNGSLAEGSGFTSVSQPHDLMAFMSVDELNRRIITDDKERRVIRVPGPLVIRRGCGCMLSEKKEKDQKEALQGDYLDNLQKKIRHFGFDSITQKTVFMDDVEIFWKKLRHIFQKEVSKRTEALKSLADEYRHTLAKHADLEISLNYWLKIIIDILNTHDICHVPEFDQFFLDIMDETSDAIEQAISKIHRTREGTDYSLMLSSQRLMRSRDLETTTQVTLELLKFNLSDFSCFLLIPDDENLKRNNMLRMAGKMVDNQIIVYSKNPVYIDASEISRIKPLEITEEGQQNHHLAVIPLGADEEVLGIVMTNISLHRSRWTVLRTVQLNLTQALQNLDFQKVSAEVAAQKAANSAKSEFLSRMTHELRTPMNGVIGMTQLLLDTHLSNEQKEFVSTISNSGETLLTLISEILDFSKIEAEKFELEYSDFHIIDVVESAIDVVSSLSAQKCLSLSYRVMPDVPRWMNQDSGRIKQAITNLLSNSVKFTHTGGISIDISYEASTHLIRIEVSDSGIGISKKQQKKLFEPFSQGGDSIHKQYGGTGLGLVISKKICRLMEGDLVYDDQYEQGARFVITFRPRPLEAQQSLHPWDHAFDQEKNKLLLVCDSLDQRAAISSHLDYWQLPCSVYQCREFLEYIASLTDQENEQFRNTKIILDIGAIYTEETMVLDALQDLNVPISVFCLVELGNSLKKNYSNNCFSWSYKPTKIKNLFQFLSSSIQSPTNGFHRLGGTSITENFAEEYPFDILLVEDNVVNQKLAATILKKCGYQISIANNGLEAIESQTRHNHDIILMDVFMPKMDGETATKVIRSELPDEKQPYIIAVTANAQKDDREQLLDAGMDDYVSKPIKIDALLNSLRQAQERIKLH